MSVLSIARVALAPRPGRQVSNSIAKVLQNHNRYLLEAGACLWCGREARAG
jgi:hypothetical protein